KKIRDNAVKQLREWLKSKENIDDIEMLKLWKGLFYCFWMSDKRPIQEHLAQNLAQTMLELNDELCFRYLKGFWGIICIEWHGIDRLRMDKFYMLLRQFTKTTIHMLDIIDFKEDAVQMISEIMLDGPLSVNNSKCPDSLRYHLTDSFVDELKHADVTNIVPLALFAPFIESLTHSTNKILLDKINEMFQSLISLTQQEDDQPFTIAIGEFQSAFDNILSTPNITRASRTTSQNLLNAFGGKPSVEESAPKIVGLLTKVAAKLKQKLKKKPPLLKKVGVLKKKRLPAGKKSRRK
ncbi:Ribosomal RNA processing protein 1 B, partial [Phlyctochytrium planicorne]